MLGRELVVHEPVALTLGPDRPMVTFGRGDACDVHIGEGDRAISRTAGSLVLGTDGWRVTNDSTVRPLFVVDQSGIETLVPPGGRHELGRGRTSILVTGLERTHEVRVVLDDDTERLVDLADTDQTDATIVPQLTRREREAIAALAQRFFEPPPRYRARPLSYAEAAARLGVPAATVRKRLERVRAKLTDAGVGGMDSDDARLEVCEFLLATGTVSAGDLPDDPATTTPPTP